MKKYIYSLMLLLMAVASVGVTACGDEDEPKGSDIVGTWALDNSGYGAGVTLFQFTKDGIFHEVDKSMVLGDEVHVYHGTYTVLGNQLSVTYIYQYETETVECTYQVKGNKLTITNDGHTSTFIRVEDSVIEPYL